MKEYKNFEEWYKVLLERLKTEYNYSEYDLYDQIDIAKEYIKENYYNKDTCPKLSIDEIFEEEVYLVKRKKYYNMAPLRQEV